MILWEEDNIKQFYLILKVCIELFQTLKDAVSMPKPN